MTTLTVEKVNVNFTSSDVMIDLTDTTSGNGKQGQGITTPILKRTLERVTATTFALYTAATATATDIKPILTDEPQPQWGNQSVASQLAAVTDRYESVLFSYPGQIFDIEKSSSGEQGCVKLRVSVNGRDIVMQRPLRHFRFDIHPGMRIRVEGVIKRGIKQLKFRPAAPCRLDKEAETLIQDIVSAFSKPSDV